MARQGGIPFSNQRTRAPSLRPAVLQAVKPGGLVIVATFAEDGPSKCSGLPVMRYDAKELHAEFGEPVVLLGHEKESHHTPGGTEVRLLFLPQASLMTMRFG